MLHRGDNDLGINKHLQDLKVEKTYYALDIFGDFTVFDLAYEVTKRGKKLSEIYGFASNSKSWFDKTMRLNGCQKGISIQGDASKFDYSTVAPISFALVDLDLYLPMKSALKEVFSFLSSGGIIVADDCDPALITTALIRHSLNLWPATIYHYESISIGWA